MGKSVSNIIIIEFVIVLQDLLFNRGGFNPSHVILQLTGHQEGRLSHYFRTHSHVPLLDESHCLFHCFAELQTAQHYS